MSSPINLNPYAGLEKATADVAYQQETANILRLADLERTPTTMTGSKLLELARKRLNLPPAMTQ